MAEMRSNRNGACDDSGRLDQVIERIETTLPKIHRLCKVKKKQKRNEVVEGHDVVDDRVRSRFQELSEDPIVNLGGTEIIESPLIEINGSHEHRSDRNSA